MATQGLRKRLPPRAIYARPLCSCTALYHDSQIRRHHRRRGAAQRPFPRGSLGSRFSGSRVVKPRTWEVIPDLFLRVVLFSASLFVSVRIGFESAGPG